MFTRSLNNVKSALKDAYERFVRPVVRVAQKALAFVFLAVLYLAGFGVMYVLAVVFNRKLLVKTCEPSGSSWRKAEGYSPDEEDLWRQS